MAEAARAIMPGESLRVRLRVPDAMRAEKLARVLVELGHAIVESAEMDASIIGVDSNALNITAENGSGANGVLPADASPRQVDAALRAVVAGLSVYAPEDGRFSALDEDEPPSPLTPRELEILIALSEGLSNKGIARRFDISQHTVKFHAESIFRKLGATTRADAVAKGLRRRLVHL